MKLLTALILFLTSNSCSSQSRINNKPGVEKNYIDSVTTPKQIEDLINKMGIDRYKNYKVNATLKFKNVLFQKLADSLQPKAWTKADFDGNGYADILVVGTYGVICVLGKKMSATK